MAYLSHRRLLKMQKIVDDIAITMASKSDKGTVASYIPQLACVNPDQFSISIALADGSVFSSGCSQTLFSIQSISKVFTLTLALGKLGERVWNRVCLLYTSPSPRDLSTSRMPSSA